MAKRGIQQRGLDLIFGGQETLEKATELIEERIEEKKDIILYLRDGLNPADRNFTKYPNEIHEVMREKLEEEAEGILYIYLWRKSWGYGKNYCRTSHSIVHKDTVIGSKRTARRAMAGLIKKRFVVRALSEDRERDVTQKGGLYRILTPDEIIRCETDEGVLLADILEEGVVMMAIANMDILENKSNNKGLEPVVKMTIANMDSGQNDHSQYGHSSMDSMAMANMDIPDTDPTNTPNKPKYGQNGHAQNGHPLKDINKDSLKDSLSQEDIITYFYRGIGQEKISKTKRERADKSFKELQTDGFSLEDVQFAVEWILKNAKEELYDFSIITHTIGQAMADKEKVEAEEARRFEEDRIALEKRAEEERQERERASMEAYKKDMSADERAKLRERALEEIRKIEGVKEEFIGNILIEAKENEILRLEIEKEDFNTDESKR